MIEAYHAEILSAIEAGRSFVLLHEKSFPHGGEPFSFFVESDVGWQMQQAGIFNTIAVEWHSENVNLRNISLTHALTAVNRSTPCVQCSQESLDTDIAT